MPGNKLFAGLPDDLPDDTPQQSTQSIPEQLKGKSPEEVYAALRDEHERVLSETEQKFKAEAYDSRSTQQRQEPQQQQQYNPPPPPNYPVYGGQQQQQAPDMYSDPEGFMDHQLQKRMGPIIQSTYTSLRESNKNAFKAQIGADEWSKYGSEIEQFVAGLTPQVQIDPRAYQTAYNYVRSIHIDEITQSKAEELAEQRVKERLENMGIDPSLAAGTSGSVEQRIEQAVDQHEDRRRYEPRGSSLFQRDTGTVPETYGRSGAPRGGQKARAKLTANERRLAEQFDMTEEEYLDYKRFNTDIYAGMEVD